MPLKKVLTLKEKMEVVNLLEKEKLSARALAKRFNIGKTQAAQITKNKENLRVQWQSGVNINKKKSFIKIGGLNIDRLCYEWFIKARSQNIPISGQLVKAKAKEIANQLGYNNFKASDGWLQKWRVRNNISFKCVSGEAADVNQEDVKQFMEKLPSLLLGYQPEDIYNADESGLFFRALPDKTLALKSEKCVGGKLAKERLTILFCVNMAGQKEELLVIGKAARPRAFKNVAINDLPATWKHNKKAWMTLDIMRESLMSLDRKMGIQKRKILLFLDNAASHPRELNLRNIKIIFLPPNTTSVCQPLDQGIIQNFKCHYRQLILKHILSQMGDVKSASELSKTIDVLEGLYFIKTAWNKVSATTIKNCFTKAGFKKSKTTIVIGYDPEDDLPLSTLADLLKGVKDLGSRVDNNLEDFIDMDKDIQTEDENISIQLNVANEDDMEEDESENEVMPVIQDRITSYDEALKLLGRLKNFARSDFTAFYHIKNLESHFQNYFLQQKNARMRQSKIFNYFQITDNST